MPTSRRGCRPSVEDIMTAPATKDRLTALEQAVEAMRPTIEADKTRLEQAASALSCRQGRVQLPLTSATSFSSCSIR